MMTENPRCKAAHDAAEEAIDALLSLYWADSFDADLLQIRLAELILPFIQSARSLNDPHPCPESLEQDEGSTLIPAIAPNKDGWCQYLSNIQEGNENISAQLPDQPFIDLRDRPSPDILRVLAIGTPQVVHYFVLTMFRYGFARPDEWSTQLPTINEGEVMQILTRRVNLFD